MPLTLNIPDAMRKSVEAASGGRNTVLYTAKGQPSYHVVIPKFDVSTIDASLGTGAHEAFIVNGVEKSEILIGQFQGVALNGELVSRPGEAVSQNLNHDEYIALARAAGTGWHCITNAEWSALMLWCWKAGYWPRGNTNYGRSSDNISEIGVQESGRAIGTGVDGGGSRTIAGSGPSTWRHDRTPFGISDLNGNVWEWTPGMRVVDGEIQILPQNDAALNSIDFSAASPAWKAIDGATGALVASGSVGTVRYAVSGTANYALVRASGESFEGMTNPGVAPVGSAALQLCRRLGLYPIAATGLGVDGFWIDATAERFPIRGGSWTRSSAGGVAALYLASVRAYRATNLGCRPAFIS